MPQRGQQLPFEALRIAACVFVSSLYAALNIGIVRGDVTSPRTHVTLLSHLSDHQLTSQLSLDRMSR
jgi:hypothetical protein